MTFCTGKGLAPNDGFDGTEQRGLDPAIVVDINVKRTWPAPPNSLPTITSDLAPNSPRCNQMRSDLRHCVNWGEFVPRSSRVYQLPEFEFGRVEGTRKFDIKPHGRGFFVRAESVSKREGKMDSPVLLVK